MRGDFRRAFAVSAARDPGGVDALRVLAKGLASLRDDLEALLGKPAVPASRKSVFHVSAVHHKQAGKRVAKQ
jgi:hypothetical protein